MNIVLIGSGNVAQHLGKAFKKNVHTIVQVYSKTFEHAEDLALILDASSTNNLGHIDLHADLYILAVKDDAIASVVSELPKDISGIVIHTSGGTDMDVLADFSNYGVVYPPQSISKDIETDLSSIPFGIEANKPQVFEKLNDLMTSISPKSFPCSSQQRLTLHIAAVFANNFSNALFGIAQQLLEQDNLSFDLLKPIILSTAEKVQHHLPNETQTGPAIRNDFTTIQKHLDYLKQEHEWQSIYQILTAFIAKNNV